MRPASARPAREPGQTIDNRTALSTRIPRSRVPGFRSLGEILEGLVEDIDGPFRTKTAIDLGFRRRP